MNRKKYRWLIAIASPLAIVLVWSMDYVNIRRGIYSHLAIDILLTVVLGASAIYFWRKT